MEKSRNEYLQNGLECLRRGDFFDAHEDWEIPWKDMSGHVRSFWQAMIQLSVGAYHWEQGNATGCRNLWNKALTRCEDILSRQAARDRAYVLALRAALVKCLALAETGEDPLGEVQTFARDTVTARWFDFE